MKEGLIAYAPGAQGTGDYALTTVECGYPTLYYKTSEGQIRLQAHKFVSDGKYHEFRVVQENCLAKVYIDGDSAHTEVPPGLTPTGQCGVRLGGTVFIGGKDPNAPLPSDVGALPNFKGCMHSLFIFNGDAALDILVDGSDPGITTGCGSGSCSPGYCKNGACTTNAITGPQCNCFQTDGYSGRDCSQGNKKK